MRLWKELQMKRRRVKLSTSIYFLLTYKIFLFNWDWSLTTLTNSVNHLKRPMRSTLPERGAGTFILPHDWKVRRSPRWKSCVYTILDTVALALMYSLASELHISDKCSIFSPSSAAGRWGRIALLFSWCHLLIVFKRLVNPGGIWQIIRVVIRRYH